MTSCDQHLLRQRFEQLHRRIARAARDCGRNGDDIRLLAVSKRQPAGAIEALAAMGQTCFGENQVDEALEKQRELENTGVLEWHFIGPVQSNKTRDIAAAFQWVQSVDRHKIARRLNTHRQLPDTRHLPPLNILIQVNIDREPQKSGVAPEDVLDFARSLQDFKRLRLRGLMAIPALDGDARASFSALAEIHRNLAADLSPAGEGGSRTGLDTLSMGMSDDLEAAIAAGSTMVRVGTALMGPRS